MSSSPADFDANICARLLYEARKAKKHINTLPALAVPRTEEEAALVQDAVAGLTGRVVAWKVGAATPQTTPFRAPIHAQTLFINPGHIPADMFSYIGVEAEIAYKFSKDLEFDKGALTLDEVLAAVESVHPAIEIVDTRFSSLDSQPPLAHRADQGSHGALIIGDPIAGWRSMNPQQQRVILELNGGVVSDKIDANTAGNPENLLVWLANKGAVSLGGIKAGQYVTTGSCSGTIMAKAPVRIKATFFGRGTLDMTIE